MPNESALQDVASLPTGLSRHNTEPGAWAFHCHILPHAEGRDGMYGRVTALVIQDKTAKATTAAAASPVRSAAYAAGSTAFECRIL